VSLDPQNNDLYRGPELVQHFADSESSHLRKGAAIDILLLCFSYVLAISLAYPSGGQGGILLWGWGVGGGVSTLCGKY
jgi:hypothetical protein